VEQLAHKAGAGIPGQGDDRDNRLADLGPLAGIMTGACVGVAATFVRPILARIPAALAAVALGALAMAGSDGRLVALGLTKPDNWASNIIPHLGYGAVSTTHKPPSTRKPRRTRVRPGPR
jgi:hypothetical protein